MQQPIPPEVKAAVERGNKIEAIRLLREATGIGLKEAKYAVEHLDDLRAVAAPPPGVPPPGSELVMDALRRGSQIEAIRLYRELTGVGLKEAKDAVDAMQQAQAGLANGLAPGEVKGTSGATWATLIVLACAAATYFFVLRG